MKFLNVPVVQINIDDYFNDDKKCLEFIANIKWAKGYKCRKCGNENYCTGKTPYSRRCTRCKTDESATAHTIFHNCKFPICKAFYIAYSICTKREKISCYQFARKLGLRPMTCWKFKRKIEAFVLSNKDIPNEEKAFLMNILSEPLEKD